MSKAEQPPKPAKRKNRCREAHSARIKQSKLLHATLKVVYPDLFDIKNPVPLALGIDKQIADGFPSLSRNGVRRFLRWWCTRPAYIKVRDSGAERRGLPQ